MPALIIFISLMLVVFFSYQISKNRQIGFVPALFICILLTPLIGFFIVTSFPKKESISTNQ